MKKILVYGWSTYGHPTLELISKELAAGFESLGREVLYCPLEDTQKLQYGYYEMRNGNVDFSIGINNTPSILTIENGENCYKNLDVPYVSILLDAPYNPTIGNILFDCKKHFVCVLDKSHLSLIDALFPQKKFMGKMFLPLGGITNKSEKDIFSKKKSYDVIYASSAYGSGNLERGWRSIAKCKSYYKILDDIADYLLCNAVSVDDGVRYVLTQRGLYDEEFRKKILPFYFLLFSDIKAARRVKGLELLVKNDICVDIFGDGWENVPLFNSKWGKNMKLHGMVSYEEVLDATSKAKIVYQDQAEFNNGAHDRVFSSMLNGAVVVSEYSTYLEKEFSNGRDIFLYDWKNGLSQVQVVHDLLSDESKRLSAAISAYGKVKDKHQWANRAEKIIETMSLL